MTLELCEFPRLWLWEFCLSWLQESAQHYLTLPDRVSDRPTSSLGGFRRRVVLARFSAESEGAVKLGLSFHRSCSDDDTADCLSSRVMEMNEGQKRAFWRRSAKHAGLHMYASWIGYRQMTPRHNRKMFLFFGEAALSVFDYICSCGKVGEAFYCDTQNF